MLARFARNAVLGWAKVHRTVVSSSFSTVATVPSAFCIHGGVDGVRSSLRTIFSYQNTMSSAVNGSPSDHFMPGRKNTVHWVKSSLDSQPLAMWGMTSPPSGELRTRAS